METRLKKDANAIQKLTEYSNQNVKKKRKYVGICQSQRKTYPKLDSVITE